MVLETYGTTGDSPNDPTIGEGLRHWKCLLPIETKRHED